MPSFNWITFNIDLRRIPWQHWVHLGQCVAMCDYIKTVPLKPAIRDYLHLIYLAKGVHATTAIEGNTLTEEQVRDVIEKRVKLPPSKEYLKQEVQNIIEACNEIGKQIAGGHFGNITIEKICDFNRNVLSHGAPCDDAAIPGKIRENNVVVGNVYRAPDPQNLPDMMEKFCQWMNGKAFKSDDMPEHFAILKAVAAHLYIAWIHPFGDGNGRVARLLEFAILLSSGIPSPAAHLLSNHYNTTRSEYYRKLDMASKISDPTDFFTYAIQGFFDGLHEQLKYIRQHITDVCWREYVYEMFHQIGVGKVIKRRRGLALAISAKNEPLDRKSLMFLMSKEYAGKTYKTLMRDLNELERLKLIVRKGDKYLANKGLISKFLPFST
jgi:Fic family protein